MTAFIFRLSFALIPLVCAMFFSYIPFPVVGRTENIFWGFVYAIGYEIVAVTRPEARLRFPVDRPYGVFAALIWPLLASAALFWLAGKVWKLGPNSRFWAWILLTISLCIAVPKSWLSHSPFNEIPLYGSISDSIY